MRLGFDAKRANANRTGLGNYSRYIIAALAEFKPEYTSFLYVPKRETNREYEMLLSNFSNLKEQLPKSFLSKIFHHLWRSTTLAKDAEKDGVKILHGLSNEMPFRAENRGIINVVTIHDLIFLIRPKEYGFLDRFIYNLKFRYACEKADKIVAVSECTKRDIMKFYGTDSSKIEVIYQGCDQQFSEKYCDKISREDLKKRQDKVRKEYNLPEKFILSVGTIEERKNLLLCIKALEYLSKDIKLVAVGKATPYIKKIIEYAKDRGVLNRVVLIHDCSYADLPAIYQLASVFCYPSRYEGFGIPIIEALSSGIPTIAATGSCLEEAGGDAAIYIDPDDAEALATAVIKFIDNKVFRTSQIQKGREHIKKFSPQKIAEDLDKLYRSIKNL